MKIVNRYGTPEIFVKAYENVSASYDKGDDVYLSATGLIAPPQIRVLKERYADVIETDIVDCLYMLGGSLAHMMFEAAVYGDPMNALDKLRALAKSGKKDVRLYINIIKNYFMKPTKVMVEERLYGYVDVPGYGKVKISGKVDMATRDKDGAWIVEDYKMVSVWSVIHGLKKEWDQQGNIYAWLLRENGYANVKRVSFIGWMRDWQRRRAANESDYPPKQVATLDAEIRDHEWVTRWLQARLKLHLDADRGIVPECTDEERWADPDRWAVVKRGNKKASRVLDSEEEARNWISENGKEGADYEIQIRKSESTRCKYYCEAAPYCEQWKRIERMEDGTG